MKVAKKQYTEGALSIKRVLFKLQMWWTEQKLYILHSCDAKK